MNVKQVRELARTWAEEECGKIQGFRGAFLHGSINWMADDMPWSSTSDVDIASIIENLKPNTMHLRRTLVHGVIFEQSFKPFDELQNAEQVLGTYHIAPHFTIPTCILVDPNGYLTDIHRQVVKEYARRTRVRQRCEDVRHFTISMIEDMVSSEPSYQRPQGLFYTAVLPAQLLLVAVLRNPTWRKALICSREILERYEELPLHESLLQLLGSADMKRVEVESFHQELETAFDQSVTVHQTPFNFDSFINTLSRHSVINGTRELIEAGFHREAMAWMLVMRVICQRVIENDSPESKRAEFRAHYEHLLHSLGLYSFSDYEERAKQARQILAEVMETAERIMASHDQIMD